MTIYAYKTNQSAGHFTLDTGKSASNNDTVDLDEIDMKKKLVKGLIAKGKLTGYSGPRLIIVRKSGKGSASSKGTGGNKSESNKTKK